MAPAVIAALVSAIAGGAMGVGSSIANRRSEERAQETSEEIAGMNNQADWDQLMAQIANEESMANPFRDQVNQAQTLANLDELERGAYTPFKMDFGNSPYASYIPQMSGGYSYSKSPELTQAAGALKRNVLAGNGAPTMTNPDNYGKSGAMDLLAVLAGTTPAWQGTSVTGNALGRTAGGARAVSRTARRRYKNPYADDFEV